MGNKSSKKVKNIDQIILNKNLEKGLVKHLTSSRFPVIIITGLKTESDKTFAINHITKHAKSLSINVSTISDKKDIMLSVENVLKPKVIVYSCNTGPIIAEHVRQNNVVIVDGYSNFNFQIALQEGIDSIGYESMSRSKKWTRAKPLFLVDIDDTRLQATNMMNGPLYGRTCSYNIETLINNLTSEKNSSGTDSPKDFV